MGKAIWIQLCVQHMDHASKETRAIVIQIGLGPIVMSHGVSEDIQISLSAMEMAHVKNSTLASVLTDMVGLNAST